MVELDFSEYRETLNTISGMGFPVTDNVDHALITISPETEVMVARDELDIYFRLEPGMRDELGLYTYREEGVMVKVDIFGKERKIIVFRDSVYVNIFTDNKEFGRYIKAIAPKRDPVEAASSPVFEDRAYGPPQEYVYPSLLEE